MVEQMVNSKFSKYGLGKLGSLVDQPPVSIKKVENIPLQKEPVSTKDTTKISNPKNPIPNQGPPPNHSPGSTTPHFVYARRKSDADVIKRVSEQTRNADCTISQPKATIAESKGEGKFEIARISMNSTVETSLRKHDQRQLEEREKYWSERFGQLQNYLKNCDSSKQEAYLQRLRSFTAEELSKHAVELERRAIHLFLEEGRELQRMKALNVIGGKIPSK